MIAHLPNLNAIFKRHAIHPKFWAEFRAVLTERNKRPSKELRTRLDHVANYKAALKEGMDELSKPLGFTFASTKKPKRYESLKPEDIMLMSSAGAPSEAR